MIMMMKINFHIYDPVPSLTLSLGCFFERSMVRLDQDVIDLSLKLNGKRCHFIIRLL
jgi:hypothetical protein